MLKYDEQEKLIAETIAKFPKVFGLKNRRPNKFRINKTFTYVDHTNTVQLCVEILLNNQWASYAKGNENELAAAIEPES